MGNKPSQDISANLWSWQTMFLAFYWSAGSLYSLMIHIYLPRRYCQLVLPEICRPLTDLPTHLPSDEAGGICNLLACDFYGMQGRCSLFL